MREAVKEGGAHPTHEGSESIITTLAPFIDEYARKYGEIADKAWREEYVNNTYYKHLSWLDEIMNGRAKRKLKKKKEKVKKEEREAVTV